MDMITLTLFTCSIAMVVFGLIFIPTAPPARQYFYAGCVAVGFAIADIIALCIIIVKLKGVA